MTEGFFILTTIFVAYVVYAVIVDQKATTKTKAPKAKPEAQAAAVEQPKPKVAAAKETPAAIKPAATKTVAPKAAVTKADAPIVKAKPALTKVATTKSSAAKKSSRSAGLKDPKTGEITTTYSDYRFAKPWIKDALVAEGLLDKVYTDNELKATTEPKIKRAIGQLETMGKYKA